jgi:hypothetical protein
MQIGPLGQALFAQILNIIVALIVLLIGWIIAKLISGWVNKLVQRSRLGKRVDDSFAQSGVAQEPKTASWIGTLVFWVIMIFVLVAVFQILSLTFLSAVLQGLLTIVFAYIPRLLAAGLLALVAWVVASLIRALLVRILNALHVDERVAKGASGPEAAPAATPIATGVGEIAYWLTWLIFLPMILQALNMTSLMAPVQNLIDKILLFLPNLFAAAVILLVGLLVAQIVRRIVAGVLAALGLDRLGTRMGLGRESGSMTLSAILGLLVYIIILIPVITAALDALGLSSLTVPLSNMMGQMVGSLPNILAAILIIVVAYIVGRLVATLVTGLLATLGVDDWLSRIGLVRQDAQTGFKLSVLIGQIILVAIVLFAAMEAAAFLNFTAVTALIAVFIGFAGRVLLGLVIIALGMWLANIVGAAIMATGQRQAGLLAMVARIAILVFAAAMGLQQMGLADSIVNMAFGLTLGALALAAAIAFGWGGHEIAGRELRKWVEDVKAGPVIPLPEPEQAAPPAEPPAAPEA